ncbi:unnamed protein product [marine sediment metagenome]|uniref:Uncharacterized protein n=1 Tax=marine sediment metagenome TaxID=412755 RepID=X0UNF6_9ZZZZ
MKIMAEIPLINFLSHFDILGFKDIVENNKITDLVPQFNEFFIKNLKVSSHLSHKMFGKTVLPDPKTKLAHLIQFSDTVILFSDVPPQAPLDHLYNSLMHLLLASSGTLASCIFSGFPIRGAVSHGEFYVYVNGSENIYLGKSLIEAYKWEREQDWAGAILSPSCEQWLIKNNVMDRALKSEYIVPYRVPLKNREYKEYYAVNWPVVVPQEKKEAIEAIERSFQLNNYEKSWAVQRKMEETIKFFDKYHKNRP